MRKIHHNEEHDCCMYMDGDKHAMVLGDNCCQRVLDVPENIMAHILLMPMDEQELFLSFLGDVADIAKDHGGDMIEAMSDPRFREIYEKHRDKPEIKKLRGRKYS